MEANNASGHYSIDRKGKSLGLAEYIADAIEYGIESPRAAVRVARASESREDVEDYSGVILRHK